MYLLSFCNSFHYSIPKTTNLHTEIFRKHVFPGIYRQLGPRGPSFESRNRETVQKTGEQYATSRIRPYAKSKPTSPGNRQYNIPGSELDIRIWKIPNRGRKGTI